jgi:hypothetical protein
MALVFEVILKFTTPTHGTQATLQIHNTKNITNTYDTIIHNN